MNEHSTDRPDIVAEAVKYVKVLFAANSGGHDASHTLRVWRCAMRIAAM